MVLLLILFKIRYFCCDQRNGCGCNDIYPDGDHYSDCRSNYNILEAELSF